MYSILLTLHTCHTTCKVETNPTSVSCFNLLGHPVTLSFSLPLLFLTRSPCCGYLMTKLCVSISRPQPLFSRTPELPTMAQVRKCLFFSGDVLGRSS